MEKAKHLTYLVTKKDGAYSFNTSFGDYTSSDLSDLEDAERILTNITSVYIGAVEPNDGMPALDAREDDIPMITGIEYDSGILEIIILSNNNDDVVELANTIAISEISPNQEITARILGDWCLDSLTGNTDSTPKQTPQYVHNDINESVEAVQGFYSKNDIDFIVRAKDSAFEAHLNDCDFYSGKYDYLVDGIIKALDSSIDLNNIVAYQSLPLGVVPADESYRLDVNQRKLNLIQLLSLKHAINKEIHEELEIMTIVTEKRGRYVD